MDLRALRGHWAARAALPAISAETMTGADRRAQALGTPGGRLMEHAGTAVAAAVKALAVDLGRWGSGPIVILCGPGNNGGDGYVAARRLALDGASVVVAVVAAEGRPSGADSAKNWDRVARDAGIVKVHAPVARDVAMFGLGIDKAAVVVDALLGTGHPDGGRPVERRTLRSGSRRRPDGHLPPAQDRPPDPPRRALRRQGPRRTDRHPGRGGSWLNPVASAGNRAGARSSSSRHSPSPWSWGRRS
jgi:hydroxyethylthiazole kinase-like uncharacterized protein yjeF